MASAATKSIPSPPGAPSSGTGGPMDKSRLDAAPPTPPNGAVPKADPSTWAGPAGQGSAPTGQLEQVVLEHAMLAEQLLTSLGKMLPSFVPVASQMVSAMRNGIVQSLQHATQSPNTSLAAGAAPPNPPPPPMAPPQGAAPAGGPAGPVPPPPGQPSAPGQ